MCRSKADGGRRCPGSHVSPATVSHAGPDNVPAAGSAAARRPADQLAADHLAAELNAATGRLAGEGDAQYALEQTADSLRHAYANAGQLRPLDDKTEALREAMLDVAEAIDTGLGDEHTDRHYLREDTEKRLQELAGAPGVLAADRTPQAAGPGETRPGPVSAQIAARERIRLTPRRIAALQQASAHPKGSIPAGGLSARDEEALEQLGYAASIDDCGHVNDDPGATSLSEHRGHPHFFRITEAGRAALHVREAEAERAAGA